MSKSKVQSEKNDRWEKVASALNDESVCEYLNGLTEIQFSFDIVGVAAELFNVYARHLIEYDFKDKSVKVKNDMEKDVGRLCREAVDFIYSAPEDVQEFLNHRDYKVLVQTVKKFARVFASVVEKEGKKDPK